MYLLFKQMSIENIRKELLLYKNEVKQNTYISGLTYFFHGLKVNLISFEKYFKKYLCHFGVKHGQKL